MGFKDLELRENEEILISGAANKWQTVGSKGGKLFLTNQRLIFKAHGFNFGSKVDEYELTEIESSNNTFNIKVTSNLVSFTITFYTNKNEKLSFVVTRKQKDQWVLKISEAIKGVVLKNVDDNLKEEASSKIKVIKCDSCGAFVVVTLGSVVHCDYCRRPFTL